MSRLKTVNVMPIDSPFADLTVKEPSLLKQIYNIRLSNTSLH